MQHAPHPHPAVADNLDYNQIDVGIRRLVRWCRARGFETISSSDGSGTDGDSYPRVLIDVCPCSMFDETVRLHTLVQNELGITPGPSDLPGSRPGVHLIFDAGEHEAIIWLVCVVDSMLPEGN